MQKVQFLSDVEYQTCDTYGDPIQMAILGVTPNMSKIIEKCARVCYRSEGKLSPDSHKAILKKLARSGHYSTFEHSNIVIGISNSNSFIGNNLLELLTYYPHITVVPALDVSEMYILRCNARTIVEMFEDFMTNTWKGCQLMNNPIFLVMLKLRKQLPFEMFEQYDIPEQWETPIEKEQEYINNQSNVQVVHIDNFPWQSNLNKILAEKLSVATLIVDMNRQISHQFVRHRMSSYSQESQRYVELSDRFEYMPSDNKLNAECFEVDFDDVFPQACAKKHMSYEEMMIAELAFYKAIRNAGFKPEIARGVLPNDCKTKIAVTRTIEQWRHYFKLRLEQHAQSLHRELAQSMLKAIQENSYWLQDIKEERE